MADHNGEIETFQKVLADPRLSAMKAALEKDHAITCLLLLSQDLGRWGPAKKFIKQNNSSISDGTFRARMIELRTLGLARSIRLDPMKKYYVKTELGEKVAGLLYSFFEQLQHEVDKQPVPVPIPNQFQPY